MRSKEQYYDSVLENRRLAKDPEVMKCTCTSTLCEWHGKCAQCVALHRHHGEHVPACLQPLLADKVRALADTVEMLVNKKEPTPTEYRLYVRRRDAGEE